VLDFISSHIDKLIAGIVVGLPTWYFTRNQRDANVRVTQGDALQGMQLAYDKLVEDMNAKFDELKNDNAELKVQITKLHTENSELKKLIKTLQRNH
jgi:septal ring factor EnvC (AmiA/AmiB activator)